MLAFKNPVWAVSPYASSVNTIDRLVETLDKVVDRRKVWGLGCGVGHVDGVFEREGMRVDAEVELLASARDEPDMGIVAPEGRPITYESRVVVGLRVEHGAPCNIVVITDATVNPVESIEMLLPSWKGMTYSK
jgi:hypothetical protein